MQLTPKNSRTFTRRTYSIYRHQRRRAGGPLPYSLDLLRSILAAATVCPYCGSPLAVATMSVDHAVPLSRGGGWAVDNLTVCCRRCNDVKGPLTVAEFRQLLDTIRDWPEAARRNVLARLRAGGRRVAGR